MLTCKELHRRISGVRLRALKATLALAVALAPAILVTPSMQAQTFTILYGFKRTGDGGSPQASMLWGPGNNLYGTTFLGGDPVCACGTIFQLVPNGAYTVLHTFAGTDGANPNSTLIADAKGNLYGTTSQGGNGLPHNGTIFKLAPPVKQGGNWTETVLHTFKGGADGANPYAGLIQDAAGNFYGTTTRGGHASDGTVFELDATGKETVLYSFHGSPDGAYPYSSLIRDESGNLYGTTFEGGVYDYGTVFKLDTSGKETVLHSFAGGRDGAFPNAGLTVDANGNFFGTTNEGGDANSDGTIFKVDSAGTFSVFYTFTGGTSGASPESGLVVDAAGNLYGATNEGGDHDNDGTVYEIDQAGSLTILHRFSAGPGGAYPYAGLVMDPAGNLYGNTVGVGPFGNGEVYKVVP